MKRLLRRLKISVKNQIFIKRVKTAVITIILSLTSILTDAQNVKIPSKYIIGSTAPKEILNTLTIIEVKFFDYNGVEQMGKIVTHRALAADLVKLFKFAYSEKIPIEMVHPIICDLPDGNTSMAHLNNTYSFHYRNKVKKSNLSQHSYGMAIDINPFNNPYISPRGDTIPHGATYTPVTDARSLDKNHPLVKKFKSLGWVWGGDWSQVKDYMHFEKRVE